MSNLLSKPPLGQKQGAVKKPRKPMRKVSRKRAEYRRSDEGKAALAHMGKVKALPCVVCGSPPPSDAHHVIHGRFSERKASHFDVIPLCRAHHLEGPEAIHAGKETWAAKHGPDYGFLPVVRAQLTEMEIDF